MGFYETPISTHTKIQGIFELELFDIEKKNDNNNDLPTNNRQVTSLSIVWPISKNGCIEFMQLKNMSL